LAVVAGDSDPEPLAGVTTAVPIGPAPGPSGELGLAVMVAWSEFGTTAVVDGPTIASPLSIDEAGAAAEEIAGAASAAGADAAGTVTATDAGESTETAETTTGGGAVVAAGFACDEIADAVGAGPIAAAGAADVAPDVVAAGAAGVAGPLVEATGAAFEVGPDGAGLGVVDTASLGVADWAGALGAVEAVVVVLAAGAGVVEPADADEAGVPEPDDPLDAAGAAEAVDPVELCEVDGALDVGCAV
jgi:hypothetical protein